MQLVSAPVWNIGGKWCILHARMVHQRARRQRQELEGKTPAVNRQIKDSLFTGLFSSKASLLELYCVLHTEDETAVESDIANMTMRNILMVDLYND